DVVDLITDVDRLKQMSAGAAGAGHRDAATAVARIVLDVASRKQNEQAPT
ncbi:MAG: UDP-N-acetylglucosamine--N-acetylmuramyl-(pentapeptide) pyrophosphoryl-undecaprenol N-acetylglucosamine transferase, partial [Rhodococcus sp. (in: high G+C Gram-positive bacteria)]